MVRRLRSLRRRAVGTRRRLVTIPRPFQIWVAAAIVVFDQITKALVRGRLELHESLVVIPGFLDLTRVHNTGAAYGFLNAADIPFKAGIFALIAIAALIGLVAYSGTLEPWQKLTRLGLSLVIGGAAGNLIDRVTAGYVLDFVDAYRGNWHFWAFNVADAAISVGVALMILELLGVGRPRVSGTL
jgi:signal peptidase II